MSTFDPNKEITRPGSYGHSNNNFAFSDLRELRGASYVDNITELKSIPEDKRSIPFKCGVRWYDEANEGATSGGEVVYANYKGDDITDTTWTNLDKWELEGGGDNTWRLVNNTGLDFTDVTVDPSTNTISNEYGLTHGTGHTSEGFGAWAIGFNNVAAGVYSKLMGQNIQESLPNTTALGQNLIHGAQIVATDISESLIVGSFIRATGDQLADTDQIGRGNIIVGVGGNTGNPLIVTGQEQVVLHNISGNYDGEGVRGISNTVIGGKDHQIQESLDPSVEGTRQKAIIAGRNNCILKDDFNVNDTVDSTIIGGRGIELTATDSAFVAGSVDSFISYSSNSTIIGSSGVSIRTLIPQEGFATIIGCEEVRIDTDSSGTTAIACKDVDLGDQGRNVYLGLESVVTPPVSSPSTFVNSLWINQVASYATKRDADNDTNLPAGAVYEITSTGALMRKQ